MTTATPESFLETTKRSGGVLIAVGAISLVAGDQDATGALGRLEE